MNPPIVYAFIDSQNVNLAIQAQGWKLDFGKFRIYLREKYGVIKGLAKSVWRVLRCNPFSSGGYDPV